MQIHKNKFNENSHWILGFFYFNKNDKRIFPPKRFGIGWAVNFGNPLSVLAMTVVIFVILLLTRLFENNFY